MDAQDFEVITLRLDEIGHDEQIVTKKDENNNPVETKSKKKKRVDRLNAQCYRMLRHLCWDDQYQAIPAHKDNLVAFLKCPIIPSDLRTALYMDISREARNGVLELIQDEGLAKEFLGNI